MMKVLTLAFVSVLSASVAQAQIVPDRTLPQNTEAVTKDNVTTITGGTQTNQNLFHSFEQFSLPNGVEAFFNNAPEITNIFTRVTGSLPSTINGLIRANGVANLFFLNPNGILFGPNATLDIGGSFLATTANSIQFNDGGQFSALASSSTSLLSLNVPIGLGFGSNSHSIRLQGAGHNLTLENPLLSPVVGEGATNGLQTEKGSL